MNVASTFGLGYRDMRLAHDLQEFPLLLAQPGPMIIDCQCLSDQEIAPSQALKNGRQAGLHDMAPFLTDEELAQEMIVKIG